MTTDAISDELPRTTEVLVVGGGIQGAGIAQAAAAAGYQTTLIEKTGWASGTSSRSSKLIHGGLRYLQQFHLGLVYESLRERRILFRIAPHLVHLNRFYIPVYRNSRIRPWKLRLGLSLYAVLGGLGKTSRFATVPRRQWPQLDGLNTEGLEAVFQYWDGQTDDALLTRAVVESARQLGARVVCPAEFLAASSTGSEYQVDLRCGLEPATIRCRVLINVAGPWSTEVSEKIDPVPDSPTLALVQGSHLVLDHKVSDACYYLEAPGDGRAVFLLPWKGKTLLGTTEVPYEGDPAEVACSDSEEAYLLETFRHYFPEVAETVTVESRMAGLRVLPLAEGALHVRSRDVIIHERFHDKHGYIGVCGGKLTGYRATAAAVARILTRHLEHRDTVADTATLTLPDPLGSTRP